MRVIRVQWMSRGMIYVIDVSMSTIASHARFFGVQPDFNDHEQMKAVVHSGLLDLIPNCKLGRVTRVVPKEHSLVMQIHYFVPHKVFAEKESARADG
jgi:hypothetical protein